MVEENELDYLKKSEVGIISSDEEDINNSLDNSTSIEENFNNEIERILIEISIYSTCSYFRILTRIINYTNYFCNKIFVCSKIIFRNSS